MHPDYYEAIIQVRPRKESVLDFIRTEALRSKAQISKEIAKDFGFDVYLSSRKIALQIGKKLKKQFNGTLKVSKTLHSRDRQSSKLLYRLTVLFKLK